MLTVNIIGGGSLGKTIANLFVKNQVCEIVGVVNSSFESAKEAVKFIQQGTPYSSISDLPPADIHFITTKDDLIKRICHKMVDEKKIKKGDIIIHCSGTRTSKILLSAKNLGCFIASVHPAKSFADPNEIIKNFAKTKCIVEGDEEALTKVNKMFEKIGGIIVKIKPENKVQYHLASVFASNFTVIIHKEATGQYEQAGVEAQMAKELTTSHMQTAIDNVTNKNHQEAFTGPFKRGDTGTIKKHVQALHQNTNLKKLYQLFGLLSESLTKHSDDKRNEIELILMDKSVINLETTRKKYA